jgi:zinc D-Ala-D-Ala carboxypeptidase
MNYFKQEEFHCHCKKCATFKISQALVDKLNKAREEYGKPMDVVSGYRCPEYNAKVGGVQSSSHVDGNAADIYCYDGFNRFKMIKAFYDAGFNRIGIAESFIHVDISTKPEHPQGVVWVYKEGE